MANKIAVTTHIIAWMLLVIPGFAIYCECLPMETYHLGMLFYAAIGLVICASFIFYFVRDMDGIGLRVALLSVGAMVSIIVVIRFGWEAYTGHHIELSTMDAVWNRYALIAANIYPIYEIWRYIHREKQ